MNVKTKRLKMSETIATQQFVEDKLKDKADSTALETALAGKVDIDQGWVNEGCILQVGEDGKLKLVWPDSTVAYYIPQIDENGNLKWIPSRDDMLHIDTLYPLYGKDGDDGKDGTGISSITIEEV